MFPKLNLNFRGAFCSEDDVFPTFLFPKLYRFWEVDASGPAPCAETRREPAVLGGGLAGPICESYTMRSPNNLMPSAGNQMDSAARKLNIVGHNSIGSKMRDRYGRSFRPNEPMLRNTILAEMAPGRAMVPSFHIPMNVDPQERIGEMPEGPIFPSGTNDLAPCGQPERSSLYGQRCPATGDGQINTNSRRRFHSRRQRGGS